MISLVKLIAGTIIFYIRMGILKIKDEWMNEQGRKEKKEEGASYKSEGYIFGIYRPEV